MIFNFKNNKNYIILKDIRKDTEKSNFSPLCCAQGRRAILASGLEFVLRCNSLGPIVIGGNNQTFLFKVKKSDVF